MIYLMSGYISLLTMKKCISLKCINLFNFLARLLLTLEKCISLECIGSCFIFSHLLTYLGPLCQLKGVSATAEKRVWHQMNRVGRGLHEKIVPIRTWGVYAFIWRGGGV